jgi:hypothetical protein
MIISDEDVFGKNETNEGIQFTNKWKIIRIPDSESLIIGKQNNEEGCFLLSPKLGEIKSQWAFVYYEDDTPSRILDFKNAVDKDKYKIEKNWKPDPMYFILKDNVRYIYMEILQILDIIEEVKKLF